MRFVLDTASFVTAVRSSRGAAGEVVRMIFRQEVVPLMDLKLGLEYRDVAMRPHHIAASRLTRLEVLELIASIEAFAEPVLVTKKIRPMSVDPNDDMVLDIAINGCAECIVTNNTKDFLASATRFGIRLFTPGEFVTKMRARGEDGR